MLRGSQNLYHGIVHKHLSYGKCLRVMSIEHVHLGSISLSPQELHFHVHYILINIYILLVVKVIFRTDITADI